MSLQDQLKGFKKSQLASTSIAVKRAGQASSQERETAYIHNNARSLDSSSPEPRKKSKKSFVYSQPANTGVGTHTMNQVFTIIEFLKKCNEPQSVSSIVTGLKIDIKNNSVLWRALTDNAKIDFDRTKETFAYKPEFSIKDQDELLDLLKVKRSEGGMEYSALLESYPKLEKEVEDLASQGLILVIRGNDQSPRVLFHNDRQYNTLMDPEFKKLWEDIPVPHEIELMKEFTSIGLKSMDALEEKIVAEAKPKRAKGRNKRIKITNTHLDLDLSKDYVPKK